MQNGAMFESKRIFLSSARHLFHLCCIPQFMDFLFPVDVFLLGKRFFLCLICRLAISRNSCFSFCQQDSRLLLVGRWYQISAALIACWLFR